MTVDQEAFLRDMAKKYKLTKDDFFKSPQQWVIIKRTGIDKIQSIENMSIDLKMIDHDPSIKSVTIQASSTHLNRTVTSFGEANESNCKNQYPVAMAEKRAISRVVLKLVGAYGQGIYSEDESFEDDRLDK